MSDLSGHTHHHGRGPLGTFTNNPVIDKGTMAKMQHKPPGQVDSHPHPSAATIASKKAEYLTEARAVSYVMQAKSGAESSESWVEEKIKEAMGKHSKPRRVQSFLGGAFLRMYLDGKTDSDTIANAGVEIGESPEFAHLSDELKRFLQNYVNQHQLSKFEPEKILTLSDAHLKAIKKKQGIAFRYTLNAVIGGVGGVAVDSVADLTDDSTSDPTTRKYKIGITFSDTYDFENKRTGEYDHYRKKLARLLIVDDFENFEKAYYGEVRHPFDGSSHRTHLDNAAVFASFMYALEKKKWTPGGLDWSVTVPTEITLSLKPPQHHATQAHKTQGH
jgi:hypothetical protein